MKPAHAVTGSFALPNMVPVAGVKYPPQERQEYFWAPSRLVPFLTTRSPPQIGHASRAHALKNPASPSKGSRPNPYMLLCAATTSDSAGDGNDSSMPSHGVADGARCLRFFPLMVVALTAGQRRCEGHHVR